MKKFWWFEQAFTFIFWVCSTRNRLLPVVMVEILCRLLVQHFWDQDLLASFKKVQWKKSDSVFVRKCYVMCLQKSFVEPMYHTREESQYLFSCLPFSSVNSSFFFLSRGTFHFYNHKTKVSRRVRIKLLLFRMQFFDLIQLDVVPIDIWKPLYPLGQCPDDQRRACFL